MAATSQGPSSGNAQLILGAGVNAAGVPIEVQVPNGLPSLSPQDAPIVFARSAGQRFTGSSPAAPASAVRGTFAGVRFAIPA